MTPPALSEAGGEIELRDAPCPACGGERARPLFRVEAEPPAPRGPWSFVVCLGCASEYLRPRPARPEELYTAGYHVHRLPGRIGRTALAIAAWREVRKIRRLLPPGGRVFEIGCGTGVTLAALARAGYEASGIEPAPEAVRAAKARKLNVTEASFDGGRGIAGHYDLVLAAHVIEHVADPARFLGEIRRILRPGGRALLKMPIAGSWDHEMLGGYSGKFDVPYHLCVLSRTAFAAIAAAADLRIVEERADSVPNDWVHGVRKMIRIEAGLPLPFVRPGNPFVSLPLWPVTWVTARAGGAGRVRVVVERVGV